MIGTADATQRGSQPNLEVANSYTQITRKLPQIYSFPMLPVLDCSLRSHAITIIQSSLTEECFRAGFSMNIMLFLQALLPSIIAGQVTRLMHGEAADSLDRLARRPHKFRFIFGEMR